MIETWDQDLFLTGKPRYRLNGNLYSDLFLKGSTSLIHKLEEYKDYMIVPASIWTLLVAWHSVLSDQTVLQRYIYSDPFRDASKFFIDLYPGKSFVSNTITNHSERRQ